MFSRVYRRKLTRCLSIVERVHCRSVTGQTLGLEVHQHFGLQIQFYLNMLPHIGRSRRRYITRSYLKYTDVKEDVDRWCARELDGLETCVCGGLGYSEQTAEHAYICLEMEKWERRDWLTMCFESRGSRTCSAITLFIVLICKSNIYFSILLYSFTRNIYRTVKCSADNTYTCWKIFKTLTRVYLFGASILHTCYSLHISYNYLLGIVSFFLFLRSSLMFS